MKKLITTLLLVSLLSFKVTDNRSVYNVPLQASAVCATDYDLDGDNDIIIKHIIDSQTQWGGIYMLENDGFGHFSFMDSVFDSNAGTVLYTDTILNNNTPDIIYKKDNHIRILSKENNNYYHKSFLMGTNINEFDIGDVDNNGYIDVVFISNQDRYWGIIYNQGDGSFTAPEYYDLDYPPIDIACDDLNGDGLYDLVITGSSSEIYFSTPTGFEMQSLQYNSAWVNIADFDNDTDMDIITISDAYAMSFVHLYENLGNNIFDTVNNFNINEGCAGFSIADFNNDSLQDILFTSYFNNGGYLLYYNHGNFQFGEPQYIDLDYYMEGWRSTYCADMDGNSYVDIIVTRRSVDTAYIPSILEILFNDGQGNFVDDPLTTINNELITKAETKFINYPNPFKTETTFEFTIEQTSHIEISVFNLQGKLIKSLTNKTMKGGEYQIKWGGLNNAGQDCKPGPYIAYLKVNGSSIQSIKLIIN